MRSSALYVPVLGRYRGIANSYSGSYRSVLWVPVYLFRIHSYKYVTADEEEGCWLVRLDRCSVSAPYLRKWHRPNHNNHQECAFDTSISWSMLDAHREGKITPKRAKRAKRGPNKDSTVQHSTAQQLIMTVLHHRSSLVPSQGDGD